LEQEVNQLEYNIPHNFIPFEWVSVVKLLKVSIGLLRTTLGDFRGMLVI
jgi:hypothetical protein